MNISKLIAVCENVTDGEWSDSEIAVQSITLLPLLVAVIKNQQRQLGLASNALYRLTDFHGNQRANEAIAAMKEVAAELEDVKP